MTTLLLMLALCAPGFDSLEGWTVGEGARTAGANVVSEVSIDQGELRLSGDDTTTRWQIVTKPIEAKAGQRVLLRVKARCRGIRPDAARYRNANALLLFDLGNGNRKLLPSAVLTGDRDPVDLFVHAIAPEGTTGASIGFFLSMPGTAWFDDVRVTVSPGDVLDANAYEALRLHLERTYPFFGLPGKALPADLPAGEGLVPFLAPLHDLHVWIEKGEGVIPVYLPAQPAPNWEDRAPPERTGTIGYLAIDSFGKQLFWEVEKRLDALADCKALVIDVRRNGGGDERLARRIAGRFCAEEVAYAKVQVRDPTVAGLSGFLDPVEKRLAAAETPDSRKVVVLQGPFTVSSAEAFVLMMRALPNVTTVGLPTRGASANPQPLNILPDTRVLLPTWRELLPDGTPLEGKGVPPDVLVEGKDGFARALELLR